MSETLRAAFRRVLENRRRTARRGRLEKITGFASATLGNEREITVYLPPGYDDRDDRRYPVLYMQDGQNVFEPQRAFVPGQHWRLAEAADAVIGARAAAPMIIVAADHAGEQRIEEYTPGPDPKHPGGGRADDYGAFLLGELKPGIDARFRTEPARTTTAVGGSSLGGLVSMHLALTRPEAFGGALVMSPSVWWGERRLLSEVAAFTGERPRIWLDIGAREGNEAVADVRALDQQLRAKGWSEADLRFHEDRRGDHSERAWARRVRLALEFLFPPV